MTAKANRYGAEPTRAGLHRGTWRGWVSFNDQPGPVTYTPDRYRTRREALAAIKAQHPEPTPSPPTRSARSTDPTR